METNTLEFDTKYCKMKSISGYCPRPLETVSNFLNKKHTMSIIITIGNFGSLRFNELLKRLDKTTSKTLSYRLKELEKQRIISKKIYNEIPPKVEYSLTNKGKNLMLALKQLMFWAENKNNQ